MEFRVSHHFACTPERYWEVTRGAEYEDELRKGTDVDFTVLSREERGGGVTFERLRVAPRKELPGVIQKATGAARLSYVQEMTTDQPHHRIDWKVISDVLPSKVRCSGRTNVRPAPGGCVREMTGDVTVDVIFVGGQIEKHIVATLEQSYERAAEIIRRRIAAAPA